MFWCAFVFFVILVLETQQYSSDTLELVHVLFRHGERTTDVSTLYPKDPYLNETYEPYGLGELTKKGKEAEYTLGRILRQRYDRFLGPNYRPDLVQALTSPYNRSVVSLQLVLAGLFPPKKEEIFVPGLNWQPIPVYHFPKQTDTLFLGIDNCKNFQKHVEHYLKKRKKEVASYKTIFEYISKHTGLKINNYMDLFLLYNGLKNEEEWGLRLPKWTRKVYPRILKALSLKSFELMTGTTKLRKVSAGYLLKKITDNLVAKVNDTLMPRHRKIFLYSGHEFNIASVLHSLEIFDNKLPEYGAYLLFELHRIQAEYGVKIYYQNYRSVEPMLLKLPGCKEFCPLRRFLKRVEEYFPEKKTCGKLLHQRK